MTKTEFLYNEFAQIGEDNSNWEEKVYNLAINSNIEKVSLVNLFKNERETFLKIQLAYILARLEEKIIIPYALDIIHKNNEETLYSFFAICSLILLNYPFDYFQAFNNLLSKDIPGSWVLRELLKIDSFLSLQILKKLIKNVEKVSKLIKYLTPEEKKKLDLE